MNACSKERRQAAAAAARERAAADKSRLGVGDEDDEEQEEDFDEQDKPLSNEGEQRALQGDGLQTVSSSQDTQGEGSATSAADAVVDGMQPRLSRVERVAQLERELPLLLHSRCV